MDQLLIKSRIISAESLLEVLACPGDRFLFLCCEFKMHEDWFDVLKDSGLEGIHFLSSDNKPDSLSRHSDSGLYISNIKFAKPVIFIQCSFPGPVQFQNVIFDEEFQFFEGHFNEPVTLTSVKFNSATSFRSIKAKQHFGLFNCTMSTAAEGFMFGHYEEGLGVSNSFFNGGLNFYGSEFTGALVFIQGGIGGALNLSNCKINKLQLYGNTTTRQALLIEGLNLSDSVINEQVQMNLISVSNDVKTDSTIFKKAVFIDNSLFHGLNYWTDARFERQLHIHQTTFSKHLSFAYSQFEQAVSLNTSSFESADISFTGALFNNDFSFGGRIGDERPSTVTGNITFQGAVIAANSVVRIFKMNSRQSPAGTLKFTNALIKGLLDIREVYVNHISFDGAVVSGNIQDNGSLFTAIRDRNTARLLKHEAKKINNTISALALYRIEMSIHAKSLEKHQVGDRISLFLNRISNNYGLSWTRAVLFTIGGGLLFYSMFIMAGDGWAFPWTSRWDFLFNNESFWAGFVNYFWLPTGFNSLVTDAPNDHFVGGYTGAIFFLSGKILIAYGIYQTIAAFRKYL